MDSLLRDLEIVQTQVIEDRIRIQDTKASFLKDEKWNSTYLLGNGAIVSYMDPYNSQVFKVWLSWVILSLYLVYQGDKSYHQCPFELTPALSFGC